VATGGGGGTGAVRTPPTKAMGSNLPAKGEDVVRELPAPCLCGQTAFSRAAAPSLRPLTLSARSFWQEVYHMKLW
jgi:hypothetical protein